MKIKDLLSLNVPCELSQGITITIDKINYEKPCKNGLIMQIGLCHDETGSIQFVTFGLSFRQYIGKTITVAAVAKRDKSGVEKWHDADYELNEYNQPPTPQLKFSSGAIVTLPQTPGTAQQMPTAYTPPPAPVSTPTHDTPERGELKITDFLKTAGDFMQEMDAHPRLKMLGHPQQIHLLEIYYNARQKYNCRNHD